MNRRELVWWRDRPKGFMPQEEEQLEFDDYRVDGICCHGAVMQYRFVDEEHGERDAAQAEIVIDQVCEVVCHPTQYVDEEGEE